MRFTDIFIQRPVLAIAISALITLFGIQAFFTLKIREYPELTHAVVNVSTSYPGASAQLMEGFITSPIEQAIAQANNVDYLTSSSSMGASSIAVHMNMNTDPANALADILTQVNSVRFKLPKEANDPQISVSTGSNTSIFYLSFTSNALNSMQITDYLTRVIKPQLFTINGISSVQLLGGQEYALRIWLDPHKLQAFKVSTSEVLNALQSNNYQSATGSITGVFTCYTSTASTQATTPDELENLPIKNMPDDQTIRLGDLASVTLDRSTDSFRALQNGHEAVILALDGTADANPITVAKSIHQLLPDLEANLPTGLKMEVMYDTTIAINASIQEVVKTMIEATIIVIAIIMLFLGSWRAVIIPIVTIPLSLIGVMCLMQLFGFSINLITLLALVLAIGLVVDDAIVVLENVERHIKSGAPPLRAAIIGTREIAVPVISMTLTLVAVYAPMALMGGLTGTLFKEFALTLSGSVCISGIIALTLSPMMSAALLGHNAQPHGFEIWVSDRLELLSQQYRRLLQAVFLYRPLVLLFCGIVVLSVPALLLFIPSELAPTEDRGAFMLMGNGPGSTNLDFTAQHMKRVNAILDKQPEMAFSQVISGMPAANSAFGIGVLKPWSERSRSQAEIVTSVSQLLSQLPGISVSVFPIPELPGASSGLPVQFVMTTPNKFEQLYEVASLFLQAVEKNPQFAYRQLDLQYDSPSSRITIHKEKAAMYGISMLDIATTLSTLLTDAYINRVDIDGLAYQVIPQVKHEHRLNPEAIYEYTVRAANGAMIPLKTLLSVELISQPPELPRFNQLNAATISVVPMPGVSIGDAVEWFRNEAKTQLPKGYQYDFLGEARQFLQEGNRMIILFGFALAVIFLVLAIQFESWRDAMVILLSVPLATSGALTAMAWGFASMNLYSQVGLITLIGLITKHGILMCEVAKTLQVSQNLARSDAIISAGAIRLRPILMTTVSMIAGLIPLLFASGAGAKSRLSIGIVIIAGLAIGTLFTLFILPVIYSFLGKQRKPSTDPDSSLVAPFDQTLLNKPT